MLSGSLTDSYHECSRSGKPQSTGTGYDQNRYLSRIHIYENFTTRVCGAGEMLAGKAKLVFKVNTGAAVLGLGYIVGLKYASQPDRA